MTLDRFMDDFGRDLRRVAAKPPRRTARRLLVAVPAAAGLAAAGVIALPRGDGVDAIAAARAALAPTNEIVHMKIQFKPSGDRGLRFAMPATEQWYSASLGRWRTRMDVTGPHAVSVDQIFGGDRVRMYDRRRDVVTVYRGVHFGTGRLGPGMAGGDPATELRKELDAGDLRDDGIVTHDGRQVRRLVRDEQGNAGFKQRFVYYMDPQTFAPLGGRMYFTVKAKRTIMSEFTISGYERIPLTAASRKLLSFDKTDQTKFAWRDLPKPRKKR